MSRRSKHPKAPAGGTASVTRRPPKDAFQRQIDEAQQHEQRGQFVEASILYRQVLSADPGHPNANLKLATLLHNSSRHKEAAECWEKVILADHRNLFARFNYARCLQQLGRLEEAADHFEQGLRIARASKPRMPDADLAIPYFHLAHIYEDMHEDEKEEECLTTAIELNPNFAEAVHALGFLHRLRGELDTAIACFRKAIAIAPGLGSAYRDLALTKKHTEYDDDMQSMERAFESGGLADIQLVRVAFGLGKAFEDINEYEKAFEWWEKGNRLHSQLYPFDTRLDLENHKSIKKIFNRTYIKQEASSEPTAITPIFIVSMPRAGSSLTEQILASHSQVYGAGELLALNTICHDAVRKFPRDLAKLTRADWQRLGAEYLRQTCKTLTGETYITDKLPGNFQHIGAIRMMFPNAKIIHCKRDPMDTALSCYKNNFAENAVLYSYDLENLGEMYRSYEALMNHWHKTLPGWIYDIEYERLTADPENQVRKLLQFVGLPFEESCLVFHRNKRVTRTASATQVRQKIHQDSVRKWKNYEEGLKPFHKARRGSLFGF